MMYIMTLILVMQLTTSTESFQLSWELAKCLTSRPAIMLTYLASMTGTRNYSYFYCKRKMRAFRNPFLGGNKAVWPTAHLLGGGSLFLHLYSTTSKHQISNSVLQSGPLHFLHIHHWPKSDLILWRRQEPWMLRPERVPCLAWSGRTPL